jgi:hypothetical protein
LGLPALNRIPQQTQFGKFESIACLQKMSWFRLFRLQS